MSRVVLAIVVALFVNGSFAFGGARLASVSAKLKQLPLMSKISNWGSEKVLKKVATAGIAIAVVCGSSGCEVSDNGQSARDEIRHVYTRPALENPNIIGTPGTPPAEHWQTSPRDDNNIHTEHGRAWHDDGGDDTLVQANHDNQFGQQVIGGVVQQRSFTTYVHVESGYRNTKRQWVYPNDYVYFTQDGGVYMGVVERDMPPARALIGELYGSRIYADAGEQKRIVNLNDIKGISIWNHPDIGLEIVLENDHGIFRRDGDDYMERFYARVRDVYNDGYYQLKVTYGTAPGGIRVNLRDPYVIFMHKNIWPIEGVPLANHPDTGIGVMLLGEEDSHIEYLMGEVMQVLNDGFYDIEIYAERDFQQNQINLARAYRVFVHEDTPVRQGGIIFLAQRDNNN